MEEFVEEEKENLFLTTLDDAADEIVYFLTNLFEKYPQLKDNDLYLTGESYAGKYLPRYAYALLIAGNFNLKAARQQRILTNSPE